MKEFIWKIGGADCKILKTSGKESQRSFALIGGLFLLINSIIFVAFFGLFFGVFDNFILSCFATLILGFLISNIYRLNLISLEPASLPRQESLGSMLLSYSVRYLTVAAFAFFVSKCFEMVMVSFFENQGLMNYDGSDGYMKHLIQTNQEEPWIWLMTIAIVTLFISPVYLRHRLNHAHEYYSIKQTRDIRIVLDQYENFKKEYNTIMALQYAGYGKTLSKYNLNGQQFDITNFQFPIKGSASKLKIKQFTPHTTDKYQDPPFNTKRVDEKGSGKKAYHDFVALYSHIDE